MRMSVGDYMDDIRVKMLNDLTGYHNYFKTTSLRIAKMP